MTTTWRDPVLTYRAPARDEQRVIRFRPRGVARPTPLRGPHWQPEGGWPGEAAARRQTIPDVEPSARGNVLAIAVVVTLMAIGGWVISAMEKVQSPPQCVLSDGSPCPPFYVPPPRNNYRPSLIPSIGRG